MPHVQEGPSYHGANSKHLVSSDRPESSEISGYLPCQRIRFPEGCTQGLQIILTQLTSQAEDYAKKAMSQNYILMIPWILKEEK